MRKTAYQLTIALFLLVTISFQRSWRVGEASLPPLGEFFSPFTGFWQNADPQVPITEKDLSLSGLKAPGEVVWDDRGVPHIFAQSYRDALFLQGYAHASDRLWQMEFSTRAAAGRLAEILGPIALEFDRDKRRRGMLDAATRTEQAWRQHPGSFALLEAYSAGVNAYMASLPTHQYPIEYKLLQYAPEPWTPLKTALFFKNMALVLCGRNHDLGLTNARALFGDSVFQTLYPEAIPGESPIIPQETVWPQSDDTPVPGGISPGIKGILFGEGLRDTVPERSGLGSNNWAVAPFKTQNGHAILCNDPHLQLTLPSIWYECHLVCPETNSYGATFPGAPGVIIGFNDSISWGFTNTGIDVLDWYVMDWIDEDRTQYRLGEEILEVQYRVDTIRVKGREPFLDTVKITRYGPVYSEDATSPYAGMACHWIATEVPGSDEIGTFMGINLSHNLQAYQQAISGFASPAQNMVFADKSGNIALTVQGQIPLKNDQQGRFFLDGSREGGAWQGNIPESHRPKVVNPDRGYVSSANQRPTSDEYPYYYNSGDFRPYRGTIVNLKLDTMSGVTPEKMKALQLDNESLHAANLLPALSGSVKRDLLSVGETALLDTLNNWDFTYLRGQKIPILFDMWRDTFMEMALDEFDIDGTSTTIKYPDDWIVANLMKTDSTHPIWDLVRTPEREDARDVALSSFRKACAAYLELQNSPQGMDWGRYKGTRLTHLARIDAFSTGALYTSGAAEALNATKKDEGPSWRMVVELGPETRAWGVYPGGQSGNPGNPQYMQMVEDWQEGRYHRLRPDKTPGELKDIQTRHWKINP